MKYAKLILTTLISSLSALTATAQQPAAQPSQRELFRYVEQMPEFNGNLNQYLTDNIKYPQEDLKSNTEGRVTVEFIVNDDGSISDAKAVRGVSATLDAEAVRVIMAMPKWKTGKQNGRSVNVYYVLPVSFKITQPYTQKEDIARSDAPIETKNVFRYVEQMPEYPGDINKFITTNIKYPAEDIKNNKEGRVLVQFIVNEDGSLSDSKIVRGVSPTLDAEALRLISLMPKWKPGMQNGTRVKVYYTVPLNFSLQPK